MKSKVAMTILTGVLALSAIAPAMAADGQPNARNPRAVTAKVGSVTRKVSNQAKAPQPNAISSHTFIKK